MRKRIRFGVRQLKRKNGNNPRQYVYSPLIYERQQGFREGGGGLSAKPMGNPMRWYPHCNNSIRKIYIYIYVYFFPPFRPCWVFSLIAGRRIPKRLMWREGGVDAQSKEGRGYFQQHVEIINELQRLEIVCFVFVKKGKQKQKKVGKKDRPFTYIYL